MLDLRILKGFLVNKAQLIEKLSGHLGSKKAATDAVEAVIDTITRSVAAGERVAITGFGVFDRAVRPARTGRNPRTGAAVKIKKTTVPKFKAGQSFKDVVSGARKLPKAVAVAPAKKATATVARTTAKKTAPAARKATATKAPAKSAARKTAAKTTATKSAAGRTLATKKATATKATAARTLASKTTAKKTAAKKTTAKKTTAKKATR